MSHVKHGVRQASLSLQKVFKHHRDTFHGPLSTSSPFCTCRSFPRLSMLRPSALASLSGSQSPFSSTPQFRSIFTSNKREIRRNVAVEEEEIRTEDDDEDGPKGPLKSHPYRNICPWKSKTDLANFLLENQIYNDCGLFVVNKPFGVGVRNPTLKHLQRSNGSVHQLHLRGIQTSEYTLEDIVPTLRKLLGKPTLTLVKSTEKLTSGVAIFADDEETGTRCSKALKSSKSFFDTVYKYHVITVLPPILQFDSGKVERIGISIKSGAGCDVPQPVLFREYSKNSVKRKDVIPVHAQVNPLKIGFGGGHLVEINTSSVVKNFLRIYMADKLAPILGDQLYSCRVQTLKGIPTKIDPTHLAPGASQQRLPKDMLAHLKLNSREDTIIIPTHVHLRSYSLHKFLTMGKVLEFEAPYPPYFRWTCEQLGIQLGVDEEQSIYKSTNDL
ncbi:unnamed protein product [Orchesella dallaii]|uniref:RNA pseudouridylate synthase domain-containing protein 4 n=1 Tax=Orchesella dallaii TaxID=48710 RepID=A0ABP1PJH3_9HEXA